MTVSCKTTTDAEAGAAIAERICDDVAVNANELTLWGTTKVIGDALLELQLSNIAVTAKV
jgi:hypothetical protein